MPQREASPLWTSEPSLLETSLPPHLRPRTPRPVLTTACTVKWEAGCWALGTPRCPLSNAREGLQGKDTIRIERISSLTKRSLQGQVLSCLSNPGRMRTVQFQRRTGSLAAGREQTQRGRAPPSPALGRAELQSPEFSETRPFPFDSPADLEAGIPTSSILRVRNTEAQRSQVTYPKPHSRGMTTPEPGPGFPASRDRPPTLQLLGTIPSSLHWLKRRRPSTSSPGSLLFSVPSAVSAPPCRGPVPPTTPGRCLKPRAPCRGSRGSSPA